MALFSEFLGRLRGRDPERARLAAILALNRGLADAEDRTHLLNLLLDDAVRLFGAERGFVVLGDSATVWRVAASRSLDREAVRSAERKLSRSILERCLTDFAPVYCADAQEGDFGAAQSVADLKLRSVVCVPLQAGQRLLGCLYLDHRFQSGAFAADDLPWVQATADQAAIVLHLHELMEQNRAYAAELTARNRELEAAVEAQAQELSGWRQELSRESLDHDYPEIVGRGPALLRCLHLLDRVIPGEFPVLLAGESGTGKELMAHAIHACGKRAKGPFVPVNIAAINPALLESELFGHVKGAFTGAQRDRGGLLRAADGGVLFLDEIAEISLDVQVKLLRFLQDCVVRPVGGESGTRVDLRVVAATNRLPRQAIAQGLLREDLYYRLAVVTVELPPLRERRGDIAELTAHFLAEAARLRGGEVKRVTRECLQALTKRAWPGNLRELRNQVLRMDALAPGAEIGPELVGPADTSPNERGLDLANFERWAVQQALERAAGNKTEAARLLGISRRALYNKLNR